MDQKAIGLFIAAMRREKGWTQTELGEKLNVTNKTVSRWETGSYMPDLAKLVPLCKTLEIGVNELLSGRRLKDSDFRQAADNNVLTALTKQKIRMRRKQISDACGGGGVGMLLSLLYAPDSLRKTVVAAVGLAAICVSWILRGWMDRQIFRDEENAGRDLEQL